MPIILVVLFMDGCAATNQNGEIPPNSPQNKAETNRIDPRQKKVSKNLIRFEQEQQWVFEEARKKAIEEALKAAQQKELKKAKESLEEEKKALKKELEKTKEEIQITLEKKKAELEKQLRRAERALEAVTRSKVPGLLRPEELEKKWYERIHIRGYSHLRYNETLSGDKELVSHWQDRSVGPNTSLSLRRARLSVFGDVTEHLHVHLQPEFTTTPTGSTTTHFGQLRDAYADIFFDKKREFRVRVGQAEIPYSFENLQSSQHRLTIDRNDALNSCCIDERDIGAFFYWTPTPVRDRFKELLDLKGSGDYGMVALGVYNGQGLNRFEQNDDFHVVGRLTYPHQFNNGQFLEFGIQALSGRFVPRVGPNDEGITPQINAPDKGVQDQRLGLHAVLYPQPFGIQTEWNWGRGPQLNEAQMKINTASLKGGYVQAMYKFESAWGTWFPFAKWQHFEGALKFERNAPLNQVDEVEMGLEWQPAPDIELTVAYAMMNRTNVEKPPFPQFKADILRTQLQWNFF